jgi:putative hydrolase of the HAD superfamily
MQKNGNILFRADRIQAFDDHLKQLAGVVWDLDNTLYRIEDMTEDAFNVAVARGAIDCGLVMDFHDALALARTSFEKTGFSGRYFEEVYNIDREKLHLAFHEHLNEKVINASLQLQDLMDTARLTHSLLTHGERKWARRVLHHIGLKHHFPDEQIFALEDIGFVLKSQSPRPFESALGSLKLDGTRCVMMEDLEKNLRIPKEMGMATVLLHHGRAPDVLPEYVDFACANAVEFMAYYHQVRFGSIPEYTSVAE